MNINVAASIVYAGHSPASWLYNVITKLERQIATLDDLGADTSLLRQHLKNVQGAIDADQQP